MQCVVKMDKGRNSSSVVRDMDQICEEDIIDALVGVLFVQLNENAHHGVNPKPSSGSGNNNQGSV